ncbi:hypothetical protein PHYSODRAFT_301470 [Phytophthora sojae]|uniref:Phospholipase D-like domain-containing protein n=1 Tax=Phytophthora sojae (strain P6497) TaxID=1094619 RepID=G4ZNI7_PHYSP|nr:hypothetical protein PHYSODRAFT_301470 [Phytophthora sojae]EGZ14395.1 hypothetical protein PHYSODRAFT_301470 [Phytophthora sojae]|eukprot:XP_009528144.1 hypothetical protein PHYSODRAFT_301470 [Phytophthora sojae]
MPSKGKARASTATTKEVEEEQEEKVGHVGRRPHMTDEDVQGVLVAAQVFVYPPDGKKKETAGQIDVPNIADLYDRCSATIRKIIDRKPRIGSGRVPIHDPAVLAQRLRSLPPNLSARQKARRAGVAPSTLARLRDSIEQKLAEATTMWTLTCKAAVRCVKRFILAGIECRYRLCMLHYKLTAIITRTAVITWSGSANLTIAAWIHSDELLVCTEGPCEYEAYKLLYWLWSRGITATLDDLANLVARNPVGSEAGDITIVVSDKELKFVEGEAGKLGLQEWVDGCSNYRRMTRYLDQCAQERELAMLCGQNAVVLAAERPPIRDLDAHGLPMPEPQSPPAPEAPGPFQALQTTAATLERTLGKLKQWSPIYRFWSVQDEVDQLQQDVQDAVDARLHGVSTPQRVLLDEKLRVAEARRQNKELRIKRERREHAILRYLKVRKALDFAEEELDETPTTAGSAGSWWPSGVARCPISGSWRPSACVPLSDQPLAGDRAEQLSDQRVAGD